MFRLYTAIVLRLLAKEKAYALINIFSLALGMASFILLSLYLQSELTYDQHFSNHERIYRVMARRPDADFAVTSEGLGPLLLRDYPQLGEFIRFRPSSQNVLTYQHNSMGWDAIYLVDENLFRVFDHDILYGDPETALADPYSIAISESMARSYFGDRDPVGELLESGGLSYRITLVFADLPENTHLKYDAVYPYSLVGVFNPDYQDNYAQNLFNGTLYTYLFLAPDFDVQTFPTLFAEFYDRYIAERAEAFGSHFTTVLQPLADTHFTQVWDFDSAVQGNIFYVYGFSAVAVFILLVACINYVNLATARAARRAREVGMHKILGATRLQLITQYLGESLFFTAIAMAIGLSFVVQALEFTGIGALMGKTELLSALTSPTIVQTIVLVGLVVGLGSGLYPAFYLSSVPPKTALTKLARPAGRRISLRQGLVLLQLTISIGVIASTLLMGAQMRYLADRPLGFNKENRVLIELRGADAIENIPLIKNELLAHSDILGVAESVLAPGTGSYAGIRFFENNAGAAEPVQVDWMSVGSDYLPVMGVDIVQGRAFSRDMPTDRDRAIIVNESLVKAMDWENPIGKQYGGDGSQAEVIGVVEDFHYASLHSPIRPLTISLLADDFGNTAPSNRSLQRRLLIVNISGESVIESMRTIENTLQRLAPGTLFDPRFLDASLDALYRTETNLMHLTEIFSALCILISMVGLFGLTAFTTQQRNRELGIRKVFGASSFQLINLLTSKLLLLVLLAAIPASLISYYALDNWLENFAYVASLRIDAFLMATAAVLLLTYLTVAAQALKSSLSNPMDILRDE
ncbi:MAG: FtsX-like permease family protein [Pseudomonadales bacterium]|nr:FtsX-like permease family protein [Pseudomonadales bacterium]